MSAWRPPSAQQTARARRHLARALRTVWLLCGMLALLGVLGRGALGDTTAVALLIGLIGAPLARVAWLAVRWARRRDYRFAMVCLLLLSITIAGMVITR